MKEIQAWRSLSAEARESVMLQLTDEELELLDWNAGRAEGWWNVARKKQFEPEGGGWAYWFLIAGRGFGKTRVGGEWVRWNVDNGLAGRVAIVAKDPGEARDVMVEGESGLLACCPPVEMAHAARKFRPKYEPSKKRVTWPNGAIATTYSSEEYEELRGPQHDLAWVDEPAKYRYLDQTIDNLLFGLRLGRNPRACFTTTPRPVKALRQLMTDPLARVVHGTTYENLQNLSITYRSIIRKYEGTRLGRQELNAEMLLDVPGALWSLAMIDETRVLRAPESLARVVVGLDPSASEDGAEAGIVVVGREIGKPNGYVLSDRTHQGRPEEWARAAVKAYRDYNADAIIAEINNGGDMVRATLHAVDSTVNVLVVHASRGKITRAEPISALYERKLIHHVGTFSDLEDQMCEYEPLTAKKSPDRMDALVWACTELFSSDIADMSNALVVPSTTGQTFDHSGFASDTPWLTSGAM